MNVSSGLLLMLCLFLSAAPVAGQGLFERLGISKGKAADAVVAAGKITGVSPEEMTAGLREALANGVRQAVTKLGTTNGFLADADVKIPLPDSVRRLEKILRKLQQEQLADQFVTTMNRAAEQAVPQAAEVLGDSLRQMTLADAEAILRGTTNAATAYFRRTCETNLRARFQPIVQQATLATGATAAYKQLTEKVSGVRSFLGTGLDLDLDAYVTQKALDGLFLKIGEEEQRIRQNPVARTTDLLQKVFGAAAKP
jgi:hypothetical protein